MYQIRCINAKPDPNWLWSKIQMKNLTADGIEPYSLQNSLIALPTKLSSLEIEPKFQWYIKTLSNVS